MFSCFNEIECIIEIHSEIHWDTLWDTPCSTACGTACNTPCDTPCNTPFISSIYTFFDTTLLLSPWLLFCNQYFIDN